MAIGLQLAGCIQFELDTGSLRSSNIQCWQHALEVQSTQREHMLERVSVGVEHIFEIKSFIIQKSVICLCALPYYC
jgi:hypothetical protein